MPHTIRQLFSRNFYKRIAEFLTLILSMSGYVPKHATILRTIFIGASLVLSLYLGNFQAHNSELAILYFIISEICYLGFIFITLSEKGLRKWFIRKWKNEEKGYLAFEAILGFLFFHNGVCLGYISSTTGGQMNGWIPEAVTYTIIPVLFAGGFIIKILSAKAVTIDIYYWKDMFLGRKICDFVVTGPYKYFSNPMYGIGQVQAYAAALWYGSITGLLAALVNQSLIFMFYFLVEKKFIRRVYLNA